MLKKLLSIHYLLFFGTGLFAGHTYNTQVGAGNSKNSESISTIYYSNEVRWSEGKNELSFKSINNFTLNDGNLIKNTSFLHLGYDYSHNSTWTLFVFNNTNFSPVRDLNLRNDTGVGEKIEIIKYSILTLDFGFAPIVSYTRYVDSRSTLFGGSLRSRLMLAFTDAFSNHTTYYYVFDTENQALHTLNTKFIYFFNSNMGTSLDGSFLYENTQNATNYNINLTLIFRI